MVMPDSKNTVPVLRRSHEILVYILRKRGFIPVGEISKELEIPRATALRILETLSRQGYLTKHEQKPMYASGHTILELAGLLSRIQDLGTIAQPFIEDLSEEIGETVKLNVLKGKEVEVLCCCPGRKSIHVSISKGTTFPWYTGAAGKVLLAFSPEEKQEQFLADRFRKFTSRTLTDKNDFLKVFRKIRKEGLGYDKGEFLEEINAVSAPVYNYKNEVIAAISIPYIRNTKVEENVLSRIGQLQMTAQKLSRRQGGTFPFSLQKDSS